MKTYKILTLAATVSALVACETGPTHNEMAQMKIADSGAPQLSNSEIRQTLIGNSVAGVSKKGNPWNIYYQDGTMLGYSKGSGWESKDNGTWEVNDNKYCRKWNIKWGNKETSCKKVYKTADNKIVFVSDDKARSDITTLSMGNTFNLK